MPPIPSLAGGGGVQWRNTNMGLRNETVDEPEGVQCSRSRGHWFDPQEEKHAEGTCSGRCATVRVLSLMNSFRP